MTAALTEHEIVCEHCRTVTDDRSTCLHRETCADCFRDYGCRACTDEQRP